jgi:hypothetical protein
VRLPSGEFDLAAVLLDVPDEVARQKALDDPEPASGAGPRVHRSREDRRRDNVLDDL